MRINKYLAQNYDISRRKADEAIEVGQVTVNGQKPTPGQDINETDNVVLTGYKKISDDQKITIILNKPRGYICSKEGQGAKTVYELLPKEYSNLKIAGRLDKDSSGLVLLTNDGALVQKISHPSAGGQKVYQVKINKSLAMQAKHQIEKGVNIGDNRMSRMQMTGKGEQWVITLEEGRNRQIRRTFSALGYEVVTLHRTNLGNYTLENLPEGESKINTV